MAMELTPTTTLEAVNEMLGAIGETPISDLEALGNVDASIAFDTLRAVSREVQTKGWWFNEQDTYTFTLDAEGRVLPPASILKMTPVRGGTPLVVRGTRVINPRTGEDKFSAAPTATNIVWHLDFEDLPESARRYIAIRASRIFQTKQLGSDQLYVFNEDHEREAFEIFGLEHADFVYARGHNFLSGSSDVSDIWDV